MANLFSYGDLNTLPVTNVFSQLIPTDKDAYAQLVLSHPNYKDRKTRELEAQQSSSNP